MTAFRRIPVDDRSLEGSSWKADLSPDTTAVDLTEVFGSPDGPSGDGKATMQWAMKFDDGILATIYDYKGKRWSIGGFSPYAVHRVVEALAHRGKPAITST
jgi:hypothetical protein